ATDVECQREKLNAALFAIMVVFSTRWLGCASGDVSGERAQHYEDMMTSAIAGAILSISTSVKPVRDDGPAGDRAAMIRWAFKIGRAMTLRRSSVEQGLATVTPVDGVPGSLN